MGRVIDIDALTIGGLEALANERGMRLITKEAYNDLRAGRAVQDDGLPTVGMLAEAMHSTRKVGCGSHALEECESQNPIFMDAWAGRVHDWLVSLRAAPPLPEPSDD